MKRIFMSAVVLMLATATVHAQSDTTKGPRREHRIKGGDGAYKQLNLSAEQQAKLKELRDDFKGKREALAAQKLTEAERRTQLQALRQQQQTQMEAILTPEQREQWQKLRAEHNGRMRDGKWDGNHKTSWQDRNGDRGAAMQKELNLTTDQQAKVKEIRTGFRTKAETVRNDQSLTQDQKRAKMRALMQEQQDQIKTVLTKEQQEKLESLRKERAARNTR